MDTEIQFYFEDVQNPSYFDASATTKWLRQCIKQLKPTERLHYVFCSDQYLLEINRKYLQHDYYTDIITFPLHNTGQAIQSDIFISLERVAENAITHSDGNIVQELNRVIAHGYLHLCGYSDKTEHDLIDMRKMENELLGLSQGYFKS